MDRAAFEQALRDSCPSIAEPVIAGIEPCVRLDAQRVNDRDVRAGRSKIGGRPDLPAGAEWPAWQGDDDTSAPEPRRFRLRRRREAPGRPLTFLAQIDLAAIAGTGFASGLPPRGLLSFFADTEMATGLDPEDREGFRVLWFESPAGLERRAAPRNAEELRCGLVTPRISDSPPPLGSPAIDANEIGEVPDDEADAYYDLLESFVYDDDGDGGHQLLGHADFIQHPIEEETVQGIHGCFSGSGPFDHAVWERVEPEVADWRLLLQLDSDDDLDLMWGDVGRLYFAIRRDALAEPRSDAAWFTYQSH